MNSHQCSGQHALLHRVLPQGVSDGAKQQAATVRHCAEHPLLFQLPTAPKTAVASQGSLASSYYSSCCSEGEHSALSREGSDSGAVSSSLTAVPVHVQQRLTDDFGRLLIARSPSAAEEEEEPALLEFATRLGFTEAQLRVVLDQLGVGSSPPTDRVLAELVKLGGGRAANKRQPQQQQLASNRDAGSRQPKETLNSSSSIRLLRPIVVDGSNIALTHGNNAVFSCQGIRCCVDFFLRRGHSDVLVFVPQFRREQSRPDAPILDQHILLELEAERRLVWTPSRRVGGRRIVCHDDRYILKTAAEKQAIVVSNDEYRDLVRESAEWRDVVESRLLMYTFVDGKFMPPDDPLGRRGPSLEQFLTFGHHNPQQQPCPYARKCTYGNKCRYFHADRPNGGSRLGAADRLILNGQGKQQQKQLLAARPSQIADRAVTGQSRNGGRTQSLNTSSVETVQWTKRAVDMEGGHGNLVPSMPRVEFSPVQHHFPLSRVVSAPAVRPAVVPLGGHMFAPSASVWGQCEFSLSSPGLADVNADNARLGGDPEMDRHRLQYHLSQLFPEPAVLAVMAAHPLELDAQRLCQRIIAFQMGFQQQEEEEEEKLIQ